MSKMGQAVMEIEQMYWAGANIDNAAVMTGYPRELVMQVFKRCAEEDGVFGDEARFEYEVQREQYDEQPRA